MPTAPAISDWNTTHHTDNSCQTTENSLFHPDWLNSCAFSGQFLYKFALFFVRHSENSIWNCDEVAVYFLWRCLTAVVLFANLNFVAFQFIKISVFKKIQILFVIRACHTECSMFQRFCLAHRHLFSHITVLFAVLYEWFSGSEISYKLVVYTNAIIYNYRCT